MALIGGCGGGSGSGSKEQRAASAAETSPSAGTGTETDRSQTATVQAGGTETSASPENQQGGAGDEEPAQSQALLTGRGGRVSPRVVRVPAYIAVRVVLRSGDGASYGLRFGTRTLRVSGDAASASASFAGLGRGKALTGEPVGGGNEVRVEATAQPGP